MVMTMVINGYFVYAYIHIHIHTHTHTHSHTHLDQTLKSLFWNYGITRLLTTTLHTKKEPISNTILTIYNY